MKENFTYDLKKEHPNGSNLLFSLAGATLLCNAKRNIMLETKGWIEYSPYFTQNERNEEHAWLTWMCIDSIIDHVDEVTETLFGYSKRIIRDEFEIQSLARDRGIPVNASDVVKTEIERIKAFEQKYSEGEIFGYTVIYFDKIRNVTLPIIADSPWTRLFTLIELFKKIKGLENDQIRLVVWFEW